MARSMIGGTIAELQRRRVFRVATAYAVVAFVLLQVAEITFEPLQLPPWALTALILVVVLLFPLVMVLAWVFDLTPEGIRRTEDTGHPSRLRGYLLLGGVIVLDAALAAYLYRFYAPEAKDADVAPAAVTPLAGSAADGAPDDAGAAPPPNSIAVLPFADLSPDGGQQYFADGFSVELANLLRRVDELNVAGRATLFTMREQTSDLRYVGRLLNVATVLEGTIRREAEQVRVDATLIDTGTGYSRWGQSFEGNVRELFEIQDRIVAAVAGELESSYSAAADRAAGAPSSFAAFDRYLEGRDLWRRRTPESLTRAIEVFDETIALDPNYAPAYAGKADAYLLLANYGNLSMAEAVREADPAIRTALTLDGELSEGFASLGLLYWNLGRSAAEGHLRRAIQLDEDNLAAYVWLSGLLGSEGRLGEQEAIVREGLKRDPLNLLLSLHLADNALSRGELDAGFRRLEDTRSIYPTSTLLLRTLANWERIYGRLDPAMTHALQAVTLAPGEPPNHALLAGLLMQLGDMERARKRLDQALVVGGENVGVSMHRAGYLWRAGRREELRRLAEGMLERLGEDLIAGKEAVLPEYWLGRLELSDGNEEAAIGHFRFITRDLERLPPMMAVDLLTWSAMAHRLARATDDVRSLLDAARQRMEALRLQGMALPEMAYLEAVLAALRDRRELALEHFATAVDRGYSDAWEAANDARLALLREEPRFKALLAELAERSDQALARAAPRLVAGNGSPGAPGAGRIGPASRQGPAR